MIREGPGGYTHGTLTRHLMTCFTPADTYSWPHLPKELFRAGYFIHEQAQALMCGNTRCHTEKKNARPSRKLVHDRLPVPPSQYALLLSSSSRFEPGIFLQQSKADGMYHKNDANSRSRLQVPRAWSEPGGVVDTRIASVGMHTALKL